MRQAKQRQARRDGAVVRRRVFRSDHGDFEEAEVRLAPSPGEITADIAATGEAHVPCNGCRSCCWHSNVDVYPESDRLDGLQVEPAEDGGLRLAHKADGSCVYLGEHGCTIRERRPNACRKFDCRIPAMFGIVQTWGEPPHYPPLWEFDLATERARLTLATMRLALVEWRTQNRDAELDYNVVLQYYDTHHARLVDLITTMMSYLSTLPEERVKAIGQVLEDPQDLRRATDFITGPQKA